MFYNRGVEKAKFYTFTGTSKCTCDKLSNENLIAPKRRIVMHKKLSLALTKLIPCI